MFCVRFFDGPPHRGNIVHDSASPTVPAEGSTVEFIIDREEGQKFTVVAVQYIYEVDTKQAGIKDDMTGAWVELKPL